MKASMQASSPAEVIARYAHDAIRRAIQNDQRALAGIFLEPYENLPEQDQEALNAVYAELLNADVIAEGKAVEQAIGDPAE